jgi:hypothetical protein
MVVCIVHSGPVRDVLDPVVPPAYVCMHRSFLGWPHTSVAWTLAPFQDWPPDSTEWLLESAQNWPHTVLSQKRVSYLGLLHTALLQKHAASLSELQLPFPTYDKN